MRSRTPIIAILTLLTPLMTLVAGSQPSNAQTGYVLTNLVVKAPVQFLNPGEIMIVEIMDQGSGTTATLSFDSSASQQVLPPLQTSGQAGDNHTLWVRSTTHLMSTASTTAAGGGDVWLPANVSLQAFPTPVLTVSAVWVSSNSRGLLPLTGDVDRDGLSNGQEVALAWAYQFDNVTGATEPHMSGQILTAEWTYLDSDSDNDGIIDADEVPVELGGTLTAHGFDADADSFMNLWDSTDDADGLTPATEFSIGTDPYLTDTDGDGLSDAQEHWIYHTNPLTADTDNDGFSDGAEIASNTNALDSNDYPGAPTPNPTPIPPTNSCTVIQPSAGFQVQLTSHVPSATWRLYSASFLRQPDQAGFDYWRSVRAGGTSLEGIADQFAASVEFSNRYGTLGNYEFVEQIYLNVFCRQPDQAGHDYWTARLDNGMSRGTLMVQFSESIESLQLTGTSYSYRG